jgi:hypothetical protein
MNPIFALTYTRKQALELLEELVWLKDRLRHEYELGKDTLASKLIKELREFLGS